ERPVVIDLLRVSGERPARYDLPLHYNGHIMKLGFEAERMVAERPVLGASDGYQHLWVDAVSQPSQDSRSLTWLLGGRLYTWRFASDVLAQAMLAESGANDPDLNLRGEPALILRADGQKAATFVGVLEPHGRYDGQAETVVGADSAIRDLRSVRGADA